MFAGLLLARVRGREVIEEGSGSAPHRGRGVGEEGEGGGDGPALQALCRVHLETPVEGAQDGLLCQNMEGMISRSQYANECLTFSSVLSSCTSFSTQGDTSPASTTPWAPVARDI